MTTQIIHQKTVAVKSSADDFGMELVFHPISLMISSYHRYHGPEIIVFMVF